jgi:diguanylate cyclase (GGDEF)-like protein
MAVAEADDTRGGSGLARRAGLVPLAVGIAGALLLGVGAVQLAAAGLSGRGAAPLAVAGLLLNAALIVFAWRRHGEARRQAEALREAEERARRLSTRDPLTGLLVRSAFVERAGVLAQENRPFALLVVDLDRFQHVNEVYSHALGDAVLKAAGEALAGAGGAEGFAARVGANEFCLAVPLAENGAKAAGEIAEALGRRLGEPVRVATSEVRLTASIGIAAADSGCREPEDLLRRADMAMREAKKGGGNRATWFDPTMESALKARAEVEGGLRRGIPLGEFVPFYQPQVDLATGHLRGFEALARWQHPAGGVVGPDVFIPIAEETGLIEDLFESILFQALFDAKEWASELSLSVNVSPGQLKDPWLASKVLRLVREVGFAAERLEIEITESSLFENLALAQNIVESLKAQGVRLALDDFGTGYSSLGNLRALPFDRIKVDRGFVEAMNRDPESLAIVTAIVRMGESLGVPVAAVGVTSEDCAGRLTAIGCDRGQGWLYGKPLTAAEARAMAGERGLLAHAHGWAPPPAPANEAA